MTPDATSLILHHYEASPFAEKVRAAFGVKGVTWAGCAQPPIMPKEEMVALTGGYRRIPVLQIGADLYFDSLHILEEVERRRPDGPSLFDGIGPGLGAGLSHWHDSWGDGSFFRSIVGMLFGGDVEAPPEFLKDRSEMTGQPFDPEMMKAVRPHLEHTVRGHLSLLEAQLADGRAFMMGAHANITDASFIFLIRFMRAGAATGAVLNDFPGILAWEKRMDAVGHGQRVDITAADAIAIAKAAEPRAITETPSRAPSDPEIGAPVHVKYFDANSPVLEGLLVGATLRHVSVRYESAAAGPLHLHMPRTVGAVTPG